MNTTGALKGEKIIPQPCLWNQVQSGPLAQCSFSDLEVVYGWYPTAIAFFLSRELPYMCTSWPTMVTKAFMGPAHPTDRVHTSNHIPSTSHVGRSTSSHSPSPTLTVPHPTHTPSPPPAPAPAPIPNPAPAPPPAPPLPCARRLPCCSSSLPCFASVMDSY
eukprot:gene1651-2865_t